MRKTLKEFNWKNELRRDDVVNAFVLEDEDKKLHTYINISEKDILENTLGKKMQLFRKCRTKGEIERAYKDYEEDICFFVIQGEDGVKILHEHRGVINNTLNSVIAIFRNYWSAYEFIKKCEAPSNSTIKTEVEKVRP